MNHVRNVLETNPAYYLPQMIINVVVHYQRHNASIVYNVVIHLRATLSHLHTVSAFYIYSIA
jgi:hypothetical protein